ncbi:MAG TPA: shikimate kinase [Bacteroidia bacterium]|nr:shikimate kinase [Bacteroidia bacterium]HNT79155.1 shikimate kinase [Bacteroidia bacterium]
MRIYLIGFMGVGKSKMAKAVSAKTQLKHFDIDELVVHQRGTTITKIFEKEGEEQFRIYEREALKATFGFDNCVVSCGGGTPCFFNNIDEINRNGISVYLKLDVSILLSRLEKDKNERPLLSSLSKEDLKDFIHQISKERSEYYNKAHVTINAFNLSANALIDQLEQKGIQLR